MPPGAVLAEQDVREHDAPPSGVNESCDEFTDPVVVLVELEPCIALAAAPKRTSLPSMLPPGFVAVAVCVAPAAVIRGLPLVSRSCAPTMGSAQNASITAKTAQPLALVADHLPERVRRGRSR